MKYNPGRASQSLVFVAALIFLMAQLSGGVVAAELSKTVDPVKQAAWEAAQAEAAKRLANFDAAVKAGKPERIRKSALDLQSDPIAVQKLNQAERPDLVEAHNQVTEKIKSGAKENIKKNMAKEWNKAHPNDPPITKKDVDIYEPTNYKDPSAKPKSGQDWDVTVRVKGKDVPPTQSQKVIEKSYYDAAGGEKTFGKRAPGVTPEQAAHAAAHLQAVEPTLGKSPEAYNQPETILGTKTEKPKTGAKLTDSEQLTHAIEYKSNIASNKAAQAPANSTEAVRQEFEQMRQASKQYDKITKPRVEAAGGKVHPKVDEGMSVLRDAGAGNISPEQARAKLAEMGETPVSMIRKAAGQAEAAQKFKRPGALPETTGAKALKAVGTVMTGIDIGSTAQDVKDDLKKGDIQGAATKTGEAVANQATMGAYGTVKGTKEKYDDLTEAEKQIANANKQNEAAYDLQAEKKLREARVSREEVKKIMDAKAKGDNSALESKFKELGITAPVKIVEKAPEGDDTAKERAIAIGTGMVDSAKKTGTFVKETVQDATEITTGMTEKSVATEVVNQTKENITDAYGTYKDNKKAEIATADVKQAVMDRLIAKGATSESAKKAVDALVNDGDPSKVRRLNDILDIRKGLPSKDAKSESVDPNSKTAGVPDTGVVSGMQQSNQNAIVKGGDALKEMDGKYKAENEKTAADKLAGKEKEAREQAEQEKARREKEEQDKAEQKRSDQEAAQPQEANVVYKFAGTAPSIWEGGSDEKNFRFKRTQAKYDNPHEMCGEATAGGDVWGTLGTTGRDAAYYTKGLEDQLPVHKSWGREATMKVVSIGGFKGQRVETKPKFSSGGWSDEGFRASGTEASARGYAIKGNQIIEFGYNLAAGGCFNNTDRPFQESQVAAGQAEAQAIIASIQLVKDGKFEKSLYKGPKLDGSSLPKISLSPSTLKPLKIGETVTITAVVENAEAEDSPFSYTWAGEFSGKGSAVTLTAKTPGKATISVSVDGARYPQGSASLEYEVEDNQASIERVPNTQERVPNAKGNAPSAQDPSAIIGKYNINANGYPGQLVISLESGTLKGVWGPDVLQNVSFDGKTLVFTRFIPGATQVYTGKISGSAPKWHFDGEFSQGGGPAIYKWFSDMTEPALPKVPPITAPHAFISGKYSINANGYTGIIIFSQDSGTLKGMLHLGSPEPLQGISFDGTTLVFIRPIQGATQVYTGEISGTAPKWHFDGKFSQGGGPATYKWFADMTESALP